MHKNIILNKKKLLQIPQSDKWMYYFDDYLVATISNFQYDSDEMIEVRTKDKIIVEPFWDDSLPDISDGELTELINMEAEIFKAYLENHPNYKIKIRKNVLKKLNIAASFLPDNIYIILKCGHRPIDVQISLFDKVYSYLETKNPKMTPEELYMLNLTFVADSKNFIPPHATGAAVDILLFDIKTKTYLDMGSPINYPGDSSWVTYEEISKEAKNNRELMRTVMLNVGFANLASEWWHFSYGDQYWALYYNLKKALYNIYEE
jgi:zinc D-Ala-D-Ala dipeptidase